MMDYNTELYIFHEITKKDSVILIALLAMTKQTYYYIQQMMIHAILQGWEKSILNHLHYIMLHKT